MPAADQTALYGQCLICRSDKQELLFAGVEDLEYEAYKPVDYIICRSCGLISQYPLPQAAIIPSFYPDNYRNHMPAGQNLFVSFKIWQAESFAAKIIRHIKSGSKSKILDIGFGNGLLLLALFRLGFKNLYGSDFESRKFANLEACGIKLAAANIEEAFPFEEQFDCIVMNNVIEHLCKPIEALASIREHLSPQGIAVIVTPNANALELSLFKKYWAGFHAPRHLFIFNDANIKQLLPASKFASIMVEPFVDPGQWSISCQNAWQAHKRTKTVLKHGLAWYTVAMGLLFAPLAALQNWLGRSTSILCILKR